MAFSSIPHSRDSHSSSHNDASGAFVSDRRAVAERDRLEEVMRKERELIQQKSSANSPQMRIRIWEGRHGLPLPRSPTHSLVKLIAANTELTVEQVRAEQKLRLQAATPVSAPTPGFAESIPEKS
ncbi:MAG: hypothetical protein H7Y02_00790 [Candidatus Obscuribacterales bacterium]|nr:hypothetical protein [Steroidobacteraceae bacterium]